MNEPETHTRTVSWADPTRARESLAALTGMEYLEGLRQGAIAPPPMATLINAQVTRVELGAVEFTCSPGEEHLNPLGTIHGGLMCTLLDTVSGCAAHTTLPEGVGYTSIEIKVNYIRAITPASGVITAVAQVTKPGRRVIFTEASASDAEGRLIATASSSLLVLNTAQGAS